MNLPNRGRGIQTRRRPISKPEGLEPTQTAEGNCAEVSTLNTTLWSDEENVMITRLEKREISRRVKTIRGPTLHTHGT